MLYLLLGITFGFWCNLWIKYSNYSYYWNMSTYNNSSVLVNTILPGAKANQNTVNFYSTEQLLDYRSAPRQFSIPSEGVLSLLKTHNLLRYRGKQGGRPRVKSNAGVHHSNLIQIKLDHSFLFNANRENHLRLSTVNTRSVRGKTADLLQHVLEDNIDLCLITETWLQTDGDDVVGGELSQEGYCFDDVPRSDR